MPRLAIVSAAAPGASSTTSTSAVGRSSPYICVTTKPPIQSRRTIVSTAESSSLRKESQGWGGLLDEGMGELLHREIGQKVPMYCCCGSMCSQPTTFGLGHRLLAERILGHQTRTFQRVELPGELHGEAGGALLRSTLA